MSEVEKKNNEMDPTILSVLAYIGILVLIPMLVKPKNEDAKYHTKQGLVLLIVEVIVLFVSMVPLIGWMMSPFLVLAVMVLSIYGLYNALTKQRKPLPLIGQFSDKINL